MTFKQTSFNRDFTVVTTTAKCQHQELMGILKEAGYLVGEWTAKWGKLLKDSGINKIDLERLMGVSIPANYNKRGFVRNRLQNKDWTKYFD